MGLVIYSPEAVRHIAEGSDYLSTHYTTPSQVQQHVQAGTLVGFGTGTPGDFRLDFQLGEPSPALIDAAEFRLRLGIRTKGTIICRDLFELMSWRSAVPSAQVLSVPSGIYRLTLLSNTPPSGVLGDEQVITIFLESVASFPRLSAVGIPMLVP